MGELGETMEDLTAEARSELNNGGGTQVRARRAASGGGRKRTRKSRAASEATATA
jgi:hypothetical protein